eukprot:Sdes_comp21453_c0_seq1m20079
MTNNGEDRNNKLYRVYIGKLPVNVLTQHDIEEMFGKFGKLYYVQFKNAYAFVSYDKLENAEAAVKALHKKDISGTAINVEIARENGFRENRGGPYHENNFGGRDKDVRDRDRSSRRKRSPLSHRSEALPFGDTPTERDYDRNHCSSRRGAGANLKSCGDYESAEYVDRAGRISHRDSWRTHSRQMKPYQRELPAGRSCVRESPVEVEIIVMNKFVMDYARHVSDGCRNSGLFTRILNVPERPLRSVVEEIAADGVPYVFVIDMDHRMEGTVEVRFLSERPFRIFTVTEPEALRLVLKERSSRLGRQSIALLSHAHPHSHSHSSQVDIVPERISYPSCTLPYTRPLAASHDSMSTSSATLHTNIFERQAQLQANIQGLLSSHSSHLSDAAPNFTAGSASAGASVPVNIFLDPEIQKTLSELANNKDLLASLKSV